MKTGYGEFVTELKDNECFVFGSNLLGFHGAGAAGYASFGRSGNVWREENYNQKPNGWKGKWNVKGIGEGLQEGANGKSYALPTVIKAGQKQSLSSKEIIINIKRFYNCAKNNSNINFLVAGSMEERRLCGYCHQEIIKMYVDAGEIPENVIFSTSYTKEINKLIEDEFVIE